MQSTKGRQRNVVKNKTQDKPEAMENKEGTQRTHKDRETSAQTQDDPMRPTKNPNHDNTDQVV